MNPDCGLGRKVTNSIVLGKNRVLLDRDKVTAHGKVAKVVAHLAEASENNRVGDVRVLGSEGISDDGTERVTNVNRLVELAGDTAEPSSLGLISKCLESSDGQEHLNLVDGVRAVRRVSDAETVP